ncbi:hypothetical protein K435DRAFT_688528 [Dendrothele bispora CBS 962.96]|uniref:Uncharacterized protein n=1 Tax=Dendrothele bispora (strain CBS 962.96) TaxID=1314807 RepID=A0A4S8L5S5_DENBC|nr:hypothetical protein K435DRAFT_688528 [Dendrothele bispora CBS 962.96]
MLSTFREREDQESIEFWSYVVDCLQRLKHTGMSDEEDDTAETDVGGLKVKRRVRLVQKLNWRHPSLRALFEIVDQTRQFEDLIFKQSGASPLPRIRVDTVVTRDPPEHLPRSFFEDDYIESMEKTSPWKLKALRMSKKQFKRYDFDTYDPSQHDVE